MSRPVNIDSQVISNYLEGCDYGPAADYLKTRFKLERNENGSPLQYEFSEDALNIINNLLKNIIDQKIYEKSQHILKELFRSLRNYVINPDVQNFLINDSKFLNNVESVMKLKKSIPEDILQIILQFLINLIISNKTAASKIYDMFSSQIFTFLKDKVNIYETTALLYNISLHNHLMLDFDRYDSILELYEPDSKVEFLHFLIENFVQSDNFWTHYMKLQLKKRITILEIIRDKQIKGETLNLPKQCLEILTKQFISSGEIIFQTVLNSDSNLEPYEVSLLLQVISSLCSIEHYLKILQHDKNLLINSAVLLINIHRLGKESENYFSSISSLAELRQPNKNVYEHPAFSFKGDLIRIIGNLCWKNKIMQDLTREAELIPVILDCCNMDARNPFIMQWVILAVHNLCENNLENQKIIAGMHQQGTVNSSVLEEMGMTLHSDENNSIKVIPLETLRNQK